MKTKILLLTFGLFAKNLFGQNNNTADEVLRITNDVVASISSVQEIREYSKIAKQVEGRVASLSANQDLTSEQVSEIRDSYERLRLQYNGLFYEIVADLGNPNRIKRWERDASGQIKSYTDRIQQVVKLHDEDLKPLLDLHSPKSAQTKSVDPGTIMGIADLVVRGVVAIVSAVQKKRMTNKLYAQVGGGLGIVLENSLGMAPFEEVWKGVTPEPLRLQKLGVDRNDDVERIVVEEERQYRTEMRAAFQEVESFEHAGGEFQLLVFRDKKSLETNSPTGANLVKQGDVFVTEESFSAGSAFRLMVQSDGFAYVFSKNQGTFELIYPYTASETESKSTMVASRSAVINTLPNSEGKKYLPDGDNVFLIDDEAIEAEEWVVITSTTAISDLNKVLALLNGVQEDLQPISKSTQVVDRSIIRFDETQTEVDDNFIMTRVKLLKKF